MTHIEEAIIETLRSGGPCRLDDIITHLSPRCSWSEVFIAVDRMSRHGAVLLRQIGYSTYEIALRPQAASPVQRRIAEEARGSQRIEC
jgi:hypothetical protein